MGADILHRHWQFLLSRSTCSVCGGLSQPAVHTRTTAVDTHNILYLADAWACSVCGQQWEDEELQKLNARAADAARAEWIAKTTGGRSALTNNERRGPQPSFPKAHFASEWPPANPIEAQAIEAGAIETL